MHRSEVMGVREEYKIQRLSGSPPLSLPQDDIKNGFGISGPLSGAVRFIDYSLQKAVADTPWGSMTIAWNLSSSGLEWRLLHGDAPYASLSVVLPSKIEVLLEGKSFLLKHRDAFRRKIYRFDDGRNRIEIVVTWDRWFYNEDTLAWKIVLTGAPNPRQDVIVSVLALFICYWKIRTGFRRTRGGFWQRHLGFDRLF